jgi:sulfur carrier protein ThiS
MSGPFVGYAPPGVYTQTTLDPAVAGLLGTVRIPALIGTADEVKLLQAYDMLRGSSPSRDNQKVNEDVSSQMTGTNREFTVVNYPIVTGQGTATITYNTNDVTVKVNGENVIVASVNGLTGVVTLAIPPKASDTTTITYYYKRTDTKVTDENLSDQVDGVTATFFTHFFPVVDGSNAGKTTTNVNNIIVKVNGSIVDVSNLDGSTGAFTLAAVPILSDTLTITYYFNKWPNTADDLPQPGITRMIRVGLSPETADYIENVDFVIIDNQIQWGTGFKLVPDAHTTGCEFFDETQITGQAVDERIYNEDVSSQFTGTETVLTTKFIPIVDGTGRDIVTTDPSTVIVSVNGSPVTIRHIVGDTGKITLVTAPAFGSTVLVTYYRSRMEDDSYSMEVVTPGVIGVGTYTITSLKDGRLGIATPGLESVANPSYTGAVYTTGPTVSKGYTIDETVTLTFTSNTQFSVSSSVPGGSTGAGVTDSTYVDGVTGLIFTLAADPLYAAIDYIEIDVVKEATFVTSVIPITSVPGINLFVNNTTNCCVNDTTNLITFDKSGNEPNVSDIYYVTYEYEKQDYDCKLFTKFKDITSEYGELSAGNALTLASYLSFLNGAVVLILCQVKRDPNTDIAPDQSYLDVFERLKQTVSGMNTSLIVPLTTSASVISALSNHVTQQSSKRYRRERIGFFGFATGTEPNEAGDFAAAILNTRMTAVYPDGAVVELTQPDGSVSSNVVDGSFVAAAYSGLNVSPAYDVAEPMTRKQIVGFSELVRTLDEPTMDMIAAKGVTIIQPASSVLFIRHGLTTDMSSVLTREQNIITIRDFIQQAARNGLDMYIGKKFTASLPRDVASTLGAIMRAAVEATIIVDFKGVTAERDSTQPDFIRAVAFYIPIVGLNYIEVSFNIRVRF